MPGSSAYATTNQESYKTLSPSKMSTYWRESREFNVKIVRKLNPNLPDDTRPTTSAKAKRMDPRYHVPIRTDLVLSSPGDAK